MSIDELDDDTFNIYFPPTHLPHFSEKQYWNGREVEVLDTKTHCLIQKGIISIPPIDLEEPQEPDFHFARQELGPRADWELMTVEEMLALRGMKFDQTQGKVILCGGLFKKICKKTEKFYRSGKHRVTKVYKQTTHVVKDFVKDAVHVVKEVIKDTAHGVKHAVKETVHFVEEHKKEFIIGAAALATACALGYVITALMASAATAASEASNDSSSSRKKEEEDALDKGPDPIDPPSKDDSAKSEALAASVQEKNAEFFKNIEDMFASGLEKISRDANERLVDPQFQAHASEHGLSKLDEQPDMDLPSSSETSGIFKQALEVMKNAFEMIGRGVSEEPIDPQLQAYAAEHDTPQPPAAGSDMAPSSESENLGIFKQFADAIVRGMQTVGRGVNEEPLNPDLVLFPPSDRLPPKKHSSKNEDSVLKEIGKAMTNAMRPLVGVIPGLIIEDLFTKAPADQPKRSTLYKTEGRDIDGMGFSFINGMKNSRKEASDNVAAIQSLIPGLSIDWIYNHSNGFGVDFAEILALNYNGYSPNTSELLKDTWITFHEKNKDNPHAKLLHICHSQGGPHTKNTLERIAPEVRDRIIVLAIAPAVVIPKKLCFDSFNYASKRDIVPFGEILFAAFRAISLDDDDRVELWDQLAKNNKELILLDPHPDAPLFDHSFTSPTFKERIKNFVDNYILHQGQYK